MKKVKSFTANGIFVTRTLPLYTYIWRELAVLLDRK